ncbi:MAG: metallophosphoesterase [Holophaga sp.]|nr:metallophosphoesterase [Holophaga sp.]
MERRNFIATLGAATAVSGLNLRAETNPKTAQGNTVRLTLLHTNDTHSRIEPFGPGNGAVSGKGGMARRATLVKELRSQLGNVLLLDAGDVFQGTPFFNQYKGALDYQLMSMVGYDAATLGNHDFDNGVEVLLKAMNEAKFPFVNCNFDMKGAPALAKRVKPWLVKKFPGLKVGITGVCVDFQGLVAPKNHEGVTWLDPIESLKPVIKHLREREKVDMVVLLSHLGYDMKGSAMDDRTLAARLPGIDVIIGGHSHTFLDAPVSIKNSGGETLVFQVGFGGVNLGRMDFTLAKGAVKAASGGALPVQ